MIRSKNTAKAIIIDNDRVLLLKKKYDDGSIMYTLPGGTQEPGESLEQAVIREAYEEAAAKVSVSKLLNIYEHQRHSKTQQGKITHKIEFAFLCHLEALYQPKMGHHPDPHQVAVEWKKIDQLAQLTLSPKRLSEIIARYMTLDANIYLGDISQ